MPRSNPVITHLARAVEAYAERLNGTDPLGGKGNSDIDYTDAMLRLAKRFATEDAVQDSVTATLKDLQNKPARKPRTVRT